MAAAKRLSKEIEGIEKAKPQMPWLVSASPKGDDLFQWEAVLKGPETSPYAGGAFKVDMTMPQDFPFKPPTVKFQTKTYHPNVSESGDICMGLLKGDQWSAALRLDRVFQELHALLATPNPDDPLNAEIATEYVNDRAAFDKKAAAWVQQYAKA